MSPDYGCALAVILGLSAIFGFVLGRQKEAGVVGLLLGLCFGPFGVIAAGLADERAQCPHCKGRKFKNSPVCPHCRRELIPSSAGDAALSKDDREAAKFLK
jgi:hypothetical protein